MPRQIIPPEWQTKIRHWLLDIDARMEMAAAKPVIVPDTIVIDGGKVFVSDTFIRACARLGVSVQDCRPGTPTDKAIVEATTHFKDPEVVARVSSGLGEAMVGIGLDELAPEQRLATRGW